MSAIPPIPRKPRRAREGLTTLPRLGAAVRNLRRELKWTQADLSELSGIARPQISDIEKGKTDVRLSTLLRIFDALDSPISAVPVDRSQFNLDDYIDSFTNRTPALLDGVADADDS